MSGDVKTTRHGPVLEVMLDRPKANAIDAATSRALNDAWALLRDDPELRVAILTGREKGKERRDILQSLESGEIDLLIGTHALIQDDVIYNDLALAIVDEQHRFGVRERLALTGKGDAVDVLVLSATPIPRTLVLTYFGDMDVSELREKPAGRQPIDTRTISDQRLPEVIDGVGRALGAGKRVYWICPLVEESENVRLTDAEQRFDSLRQRFGDQVGLVHGRMRGSDKDRVMAQFAAGGGKILVCSPCFKKRGLDEARLIPGAQVVGGARLVEFMADGAPSISY